jgi:hypothetical protein
MILFLILTVAAVADAGDLYKVIITSNEDVELLESLNVEPVLRLHDGYLVLADGSAAIVIESRLSSAQLVISAIEFDQLAIDGRHDRGNIGKYPLVFEQDNLRIFKIDRSRFSQEDVASQLMPIYKRGLQLEYHRPKIYNDQFDYSSINLDSLIGLVRQDSVEAYLYRLEAFYRRLTGTDSCYAARDWIAEKFASFGYDSIVIDSFIGEQLWDRVPVLSQNVIATKVGSRYPDRQIVVGAHFDAVPDCPGADDNGTGTAGVLEIARILADIETEMTFIFIAFDSEESWLWGSYHYADSVGAFGKDIIYMQNLDMIGHITNSNRADLYYGPEIAYARLWRDLADSLVGIVGDLSGSTASDHLPFIDNGYDVTFVQEKIFSTNYHQPSDSTAYIDFEYMTRMIKASLATDYTVNLLLPPVNMISILDVGDGQSLQVSWEPGDPERIDHYVLHYSLDPLFSSNSVYVEKDSSRYILSGLEEGEEYFIYVTTHDAAGISSIAYDQLSGIPRSIPAMPQNLTAMPLVGGIQLYWHGDNRELDFDHYQVMRDGQPLPDFVYDTSYADWDPGLGSDLHGYLTVAVDLDGNTSDTGGVLPVSSKAATLQAGRILAVNRSGSNSAALVEESVTGDLMRQALEGYTYDYYSDTAFSNPNRADLFNMVDYGLIMIGAEGGRQDEIGNAPGPGGILGDIAYYLSLGGKAIIFGRWGDVSLAPGEFDTLIYQSVSHHLPYNDYFYMQARVQPLSYIDGSDLTFYSDFIGAHSQYGEYPELIWDSTATHNHTGINFNRVTGIPCVSFPILRTGPYDVLYTYNSSMDSHLTEGKPVAWRYRGLDFKYVYFDIPLSFIDRDGAVAALRQAVTDLDVILDADDMADLNNLPDKFELSQNYPNPFNPRTVIEFYSPSSRPEKVRLEIFNILGQEIRTLFDGPAAPGWHRIEWDGMDDKGKALATGLYFYRMRAAGSSQTRKMLLLK